MEKVIDLRQIKARKKKASSKKTLFTSIKIETLSNKKELKSERNALARFFVGLKSNIWFRVFILVVILPLGAYKVLSIDRTVAEYQDLDASIGNNQTALHLDFFLDDSAWIPAEGAYDLKPGETITRNIKVIPLNSIEFTYFIEAVKSPDSSDEICNNLELWVLLEGQTVYQGKLLDFKSSNYDINPSSDDWAFNVSLPQDVPGQSCAFDFVFRGWQKGYAGSDTGYYDVELTDNYVQSEIEALNKNQQLIITNVIESQASEPALEESPSPEPSPEISTTPEATPEPSVEPSPEPLPEPSISPSPESTPA